MSPPSLTFLSVFPSLTTGAHTVEVQVVGPVNAVEIALDDRVIAELKAPPWRASVDFGDALRPHRLTTVPGAALKICLGASGVKVTELAVELGKSRDGVRRWYRRSAGRRLTDPDFRAAVEKLDESASEELWAIKSAEQCLACL